MNGVETITELQPHEVDEFVRAHITMQGATYAHLASGDFLGQLWDEYESRTQELQELLANPEPGRVDLLARGPRGGILGIAQLRKGVEAWEEPLIGPGHPRPAAELCLKSMFTMPAAHGTGLGSRLLEAILPSRMAAFLWVMAENPRAVRFYQRNGFEPDGVRAISVGWGQMPTLRMVRPGSGWAA